jgi:hypothetical protein
MTIVSTAHKLGVKTRTVEGFKRGAGRTRQHDLAVCFVDLRLEWHRNQVSAETKEAADHQRTVVMTNHNIGNCADAFLRSFRARLPRSWFVPASIAAYMALTPSTFETATQFYVFD